MRIYNAFLIAFATYSKIPVPQADWKEENMRYAICFFPLVGAAAGGILFLWYHLAGLLRINTVLFAAVAAAIPTLVTGGIHLDGFCDTCDALSSYQTPERRLEILKDPRAGAFAVIRCSLYFVLYFALFTQITAKGLGIVCLGFVLSRALSGYSVAAFRPARKSGMLTSFSEAAHHKVVKLVMTGYFLLGTAAALSISLPMGLGAVGASLGVFWYYRLMSYRQFGGVTGDLAGYFLILCEFFITAAVVLAERIVTVWNW